MTDELDWRLLDRFLAGECSPPERAAVLQWLEGHPLVAQYLEVVRRALAKHEVKPSPRRWPGAASHGFRIAAVLALVAGAAARWRARGSSAGWITRACPASRDESTPDAISRGPRGAWHFRMRRWGSCCRSWPVGTTWT